MSHHEQRKFVEICFKYLKEENDFEKYSVVDIGSNDINGSVKNLLSGNEYIGVDLEKGPNVDHILNGEDLEKIGKKFDVFEFASAERFKDYDAVQIGIKPVDKKYIIYSVEGMMSFDKDFPNCLNKMEEIKLEIEELKNLKKEEFDFRKHRQDKTGKSKYITTSYNFLNDDSINIQCYSWSEEMNQIDHLRISLRSKEYSEWIINEAYK